MRSRSCSRARARARARSRSPLRPVVCLTARADLPDCAGLRVAGARALFRGYHPPTGARALFRGYHPPTGARALLRG